MTKDEAIGFLRLVVKARIAIEQDKFRDAIALLGSAENGMIASAKVGDEELIAGGVPVCICEDSRGWSTCGEKCPCHPPEYICLCGGCGNCALVGFAQGCIKRVAYMRLCKRCDPEP